MGVFDNSINSIKSLIEADDIKTDAIFDEKTSKALTGIGNSLDYAIQKKAEAFNKSRNAEIINDYSLQASKLGLEKGNSPATVEEYGAELDQIKTGLADKYGSFSTETNSSLNTLKTNFQIKFVNQLISHQNSLTLTNFKNAINSIAQNKTISDSPVYAEQLSVLKEAGTEAFGAETAEVLVQNAKDSGVPYELGNSKEALTKAIISSIPRSLNDTSFISSDISEMMLKNPIGAYTALRIRGLSDSNALQLAQIIREKVPSSPEPELIERLVNVSRENLAKNPLEFARGQGVVNLTPIDLENPSDSPDLLRKRFEDSSKVYAIYGKNSILSKEDVATLKLLPIETQIKTYNKVRSEANTYGLLNPRKGIDQIAVDFEFSKIAPEASAYASINRLFPNKAPVELSAQTQEVIKSDDFQVKWREFRPSLLQNIIISNMSIIPNSSEILQQLGAIEYLKNPNKKNIEVDLNAYLAQQNQYVYPVGTDGNTYEKVARTKLGLSDQSVVLRNIGIDTYQVFYKTGLPYLSDDKRSIVLSREWFEKDAKIEANNTKYDKPFIYRGF